MFCLTAIAASLVAFSIHPAQASGGGGITPAHPCCVQITDEYINNTPPPTFIGPPPPNQIKLTYLDTNVTNWYVKEIDWEIDYSPTSNVDENHASPLNNLDNGNGDNPGKVKKVDEPYLSCTHTVDHFLYYCYLNSGQPIDGGRRAEQRTNLRSIFSPANP